jgi:DNA-binding SARP family transcriptional activator/predicted ATPase
LSLCIRFLGDWSLTYGEMPVTGIHSPRLQSLLAYLLLHRDAPQSRDHLAFLFWPESTEAQAHTNLRNLLYHLRHALPDADRFLRADSRTLQWARDAPLSLDVAEFENSLMLAEEAEKVGDGTGLRQGLEKAVVLYQGDLLPSCYDEWILPERERLRQRYVRALERLIQLSEDQRKYATAVRYAQQLLRQDPLSEAACRRLMRLHALDGDRASALRVYHTCATALQRDLGVEPSPSTQNAYEQLFSSEARPAPQATSPVASPLVGREPEWARLRAAWRSAAGGRPRLVLLLGEAGIGKTRLAEELLEWAGRQGITCASARCYAAEGRLAYAPVVAWLRTQPLPPLDRVWLGELARLLPEILVGRPDLQQAGPLTEAWQRQRLFEALARATLGGGQPLLLFVDDLHRCDRDTVQWLHYLLRYDPAAQLLILAAFRPGEVEEGHGLRSLQQTLRSERTLVEIELGPLDEAQTASLAAHVASREIEPARAALLYRETEGNPLFVVETVRAGLDDLTSLPPEVQAVIKARLARVSPSAREVAALAATIGREFTYEVLAQASERDEDSLVQGLDELWQRRIVREQGADRYDFSHDKLREVARAMLSRARRRLMHRRVAAALEAVHADRLDDVSGRIATHYERGSQPDRAIPYYLRAARAAQQVYAIEEAHGYAIRGLSLLEEIPPDPERMQQELELRLLLGATLLETEHYASPEVEIAFRRAEALSQQLNAPLHHFHALRGLWYYYETQAKLERAWPWAEQLLDVARKLNDSELLLEAHWAVGLSAFCLGELGLARKHLTQARAHYYPDLSPSPALTYGQPAIISSLSFLAITQQLLGYPDQAVQRLREVMALAQNSSHPPSAGAAMYAASLYQVRRDSAATQKEAERIQTLCSQYAVPPWPMIGSSISRGWALAMQGQNEEGLIQMEEGLVLLRQAPPFPTVPYLLSLIVEAHLYFGDLEAAEMILADAIVLMEERGDQFWEAELHRLRGELLWQQGGAAPDVESHFQRAIQVAQQQEARWLELRAVIGLARLWRDQDRRAEAHQRLATIYDWFTEGFDTADLQEARALLDELS